MNLLTQPPMACSLTENSFNRKPPDATKNCKAGKWKVQSYRTFLIEALSTAPGSPSGITNHWLRNSAASSPYIGAEKSIKHVYPRTQDLACLQKQLLKPSSVTGEYL